MAIEEHTKYQEWSLALDKMAAARDTLQTATAFGMGTATIEKARKELISALTQFHNLSDEIYA